MDEPKTAGIKIRPAEAKLSSSELYALLGVLFYCLSLFELWEL